MSEFQSYIRNGKPALARPYVHGEPMAGISVALPDKMDGHPKLGDMIVKYPNVKEPWLVGRDNFRDLFTPVS